MAKNKIYTVGFRLPGKDYSYVRFESRQSLAEAEVILIEPTIGNISCGSSYNGKPLLSEFMSESFREYQQHWHKEIQAALDSGKLVVVYLVTPLEYYHYTGDAESSGSGSSRVTTKKVAPFSAYDAIPCLDSVLSRSEVNIRLDDNAGFLSRYWDEFADVSVCEAIIRGKFRQVVLRTEDDASVAGALVRDFPGYLLFLPPIRYDEDKFIRYDEESNPSPWTKEARRFGKCHATAIYELDEALRLDAALNLPGQQD